MTAQRLSGTHEHLRHLVLHAQSADDLQELESAQNLVLDFEPDLHLKRGALFDGEWRLIELFQRARFAEINDDIRTAFMPQSC